MDEGKEPGVQALGTQGAEAREAAREILHRVARGAAVEGRPWGAVVDKEHGGQAEHQYKAKGKKHGDELPGPHELRVCHGAVPRKEHGAHDGKAGHKDAAEDGVRAERQASRKEPLREGDLAHRDNSLAQDGHQTRVHQAPPR